MQKRIALIDLDTILFLVAYHQFKKLENRDNVEQVKAHIREFLSVVLVNTRADFFSAVYQGIGHSNYRKYFYPDYKSNRPPTPDFITVWRETIIEEFASLGATGLKVIESDDVVNMGYTVFKNSYETIIVSVDKDLNQIPGEHYNLKKHESYFVTEHEALLSKYSQILMGDRTDNIEGIPGIGPKKAYKLLELCQTEEDFRIVCYKAYQDYFGEQWYSKYLKTEFLISLLDHQEYRLKLSNQHPYNNELVALHNVINVNDFLVTNVFN